MEKIYWGYICKPTNPAFRIVQPAVEMFSHNTNNALCVPLWRFCSKNNLDAWKQTLSWNPSSAVVFISLSVGGFERAVGNLGACIVLYLYLYCICKPSGRNNLHNKHQMAECTNVLCTTSLYWICVGFVFDLYYSIWGRALGNLGAGSSQSI